MYLVKYNSGGVVKKFKHPQKSEVVRMKSSYADVVSALFLSESDSCNIPADISKRL